jgi:PII-like signaling protein
MKLKGEGLLVRIFVGESDRWDGAPLYEAIVQCAREKGLAGATVVRGIEGYGAHNLIHTARILRLSEDLPIVVEIVDSREKIEGFLPELDSMISEGLVTLEPVQIILYRARDPREAHTH